MENHFVLSSEEYFFLQNLLSERYIHLSIKLDRLKRFDSGFYLSSICKEMDLIDSIQNCLSKSDCVDKNDSDDFENKYGIRLKGNENGKD